MKKKKNTQGQRKHLAASSSSLPARRNRRRYLGDSLCVSVTRCACQKPLLEPREWVLKVTKASSEKYTYSNTGVYLPRWCLPAGACPDGACSDSAWCSDGACPVVACLVVTWPSGACLAVVNLVGAGPGVCPAGVSLVGACQHL